jgi:hypothetical protein
VLQVRAVPAVSCEEGMVLLLLLLLLLLGCSV